MKGDDRLLVCVMAAGAVPAPRPDRLLSAQSEAEQIVPFSDPSRPGKVEVELLSGGITVRGENRRDVAIVMRQRPEKPLDRGRRRRRDCAGCSRWRASR